MSSHPGSTVTLISAERLVDGTGREPVERGAVAVQGDRIVAVGERTELAARFPGATRADYPGWELPTPVWVIYAGLIIWATTNALPRRHRAARISASAG